MRFVEFSSKELNEKCREWAGQIFAEYKPDLIVYIARAGYILAQPMADTYGIPLLGIGAVRSGNSLKEFVGPLLACVPSFVRRTLAVIELKSGLHKRNTERNVSFHQKIKSLDCLSFNKILIVDDAVDTGYTMRKVFDMTKEAFPNAQVRTACMNESCEEAEKVFRVDYVLMRGMSVKTPFSKDSKEYPATKKRYYLETQNEYV